jgi:hypothetical protein
MRTLWTRTATNIGVLGFGLAMTASPVGAAPGDNGNGHGNGGGAGHGPNGNGNAFGLVNNSPSPAQTPELGSLALFGTSAAGAAGYALMRIRASRRRDTPGG